MVTLLIAALATWEALEIWRHSSIMAPWRARAEIYEGRFGELLRCPFCLAPYTGLTCLLALQEPLVLAWAVKALAIARLANLGNDVGHAWCRTPRHDRFIPAPPDVQQTPAAPSAPASGLETTTGGSRTMRKPMSEQPLPVNPAASLGQTQNQDANPINTSATDSSQTASPPSSDVSFEEPPFDEYLGQLFSQAAQLAFLKHGSVLRSVGVFFDYKGELNSAPVQHGMWLSATGPVSQPDAVVASAGCCTKLLEMITERMVLMHKHYQEQLQSSLAKIAAISKLSDTLQQLQPLTEKTNGELAT